VENFQESVEELLTIAEYYERGQAEIAFVQDKIDRTAQHVGALHFNPETGQYYICYGRIDGEYKWTRLKEVTPGLDFELSLNEDHY
jgi:hypothetical protein